MDKKLKSNQIALLGALLIIVIAWLVPGLQYFVLPLQYLNTHLHEIGHALIATGTGADSVTIEVFANGSGVTMFRGGNYFLSSPAGYIGATAFGALMIALSRDVKGAKTALAMLGSLLTVSLIIWTRGDAVGLGTGVLFAVLSFLAAKFMKGSAVMVTAQFIGLNQCITALMSVFEVMGMVRGFHSGETDAHLLQRATGIPAIFSAFVWTAISFGIVYATLRFAWSGRDFRLGVKRDRVA